MPEASRMPPLPTGYMAALRYEEGAPRYRLWHFVLQAREGWFRVGSSAVYTPGMVRELATRGTFEVIHPGFAWRADYTAPGLPEQPPQDAERPVHSGGYTGGMSTQVRLSEADRRTLLAAVRGYSTTEAARVAQQAAAHVEAQPYYRPVYTDTSSISDYSSGGIVTGDRPTAALSTWEREPVGRWVVGE